MAAQELIKQPAPLPRPRPHVVRLLFKKPVPAGEEVAQEK